MADETIPEITIIACVPDDAKDLILFSPTTDYALTKCDECNRDVWIGPQQQSRITESSKTVCYHCLLAPQK